MHGTMSKIHDCRFVAREIINSIKYRQVTEEQGKEALFRLLLMACGAKEKERKVNERAN